MNTQRPPAPSTLAWLKTIAVRVDRALGAIADRLPPADSGPVAAAIRYALDGGGKRLRPALCYAAYQALRSNGQDDDALIELCCVVELIHTYSLMHDDLPCMDDDALRRGRPTTHTVYGTPAATFGGAALIPFAFRVLLDSAKRLRLSPETTRAMTLELARAAGAAGMVGGQVLDLAAEGRAITLEDLENVHRNKTGALIAAATRLGALAAGAAPEQLNALRTYGRCIGLAFQITDDVLDETSASGQLGKTAGKDRAVAKATFPALLGLDGAVARAEHEIEDALKALAAADLRTPELESLARFAIERDR
jgi:geranylgeranyl pyrophosphate synthase